MVGILLVAHSTVANSLVSAAEMIMGKQENVRSFGLLHETNLDVFRQDLQKAAGELDTGDGVLVLCDLFGGSPGNTASSLMTQSVQVVTGANLPMFLEVLQQRNSLSVQALAALACTTGTAGIMNVNAMMSEEGEQ